MNSDPIIRELWKIRAARAKKFNYDLDAMFRDLQKREQADPWPKANRPIQKRKLSAVAEAKGKYRA